MFVEAVDGSVLGFVRIYEIVFVPSVSASLFEALSYEMSYQINTFTSVIISCFASGISISAWNDQ